MNDDLSLVTPKTISDLVYGFGGILTGAALEVCEATVVGVCIRLNTEEHRGTPRNTRWEDIDAD